MGRTETTTRALNPATTTQGPDCQTIRNTGGILRSAESRSRQAFQKPFLVSCIQLTVTRPIIAPHTTTGEYNESSSGPGFQGCLRRKYARAASDSERRLETASPGISLIY